MANDEKVNYNAEDKKSVLAYVQSLLMAYLLLHMTKLNGYIIPYCKCHHLWCIQQLIHTSTYCKNTFSNWKEHLPGARKHIQKLVVTFICCKNAYSN